MSVEGEIPCARSRKQQRNSGALIRIVCRRTVVVVGNTVRKSRARRRGGKRLRQERITHQFHLILRCVHDSTSLTTLSVCPKKS